MRHAALALLLCACGGDFASGVDAYRAGRYADAHEAFVRAEEAAGDDASDELRLDRALAALRAGELRDAEATMERVGTTRAPWSDFLRGNIAFARCEQAARQARTPMAEPFAFDVAIRHAGKARAFWERAAMSRDDWPAARRNVERALLMMRDLRREKAAREEERKKEPNPEQQPKPDPRPPPPPPEDGKTEETEATAGVHETELSPEQVRLLLDRLAEKEREKRAVRKARQKERGAAVEHDW